MKKHPFFFFEDVFFFLRSSMNPEFSGEVGIPTARVIRALSLTGLAPSPQSVGT